MELARRRFFGLAGAAAICACVPGRGSSEGAGSVASLNQAGRLLEPRACHAAVTLDGGAVALLGGFRREGEGIALVERYNPDRRRFEQFARLGTARIQPIAVALADGSALVFGGTFAAGNSSAERLFGDGTVASLPDLHDGRDAAAAVRLRDGRVLICGGEASGYRMTASAELYLPDQNRFVPIAPMNEARAAHRLALLPDGRVLVTGGGNRNGISATAELFDPATNRFAPVGDMGQRRHKHAVAPLGDGSILVIGGSDNESGPDGRGRLASCERFDLVTGQFVPAAALNQPRYKIGDSIAMLPGGRFVVASGADRPEWFGSESRTFQVSEQAFDRRREFMTATTLPGGAILITGGYDDGIVATDRTWLYSLPA